MTLAELSALSGLPGRTIRFYIARRLIPGPAKAGRGAVYGQGHLARLREIKALQARGLGLMEIAQRVAGEARPAMSLAPTAWWQYAVAEDVTVSVRGDVSPWRLKQIKRYLAQMAAGLRRHDQE